MSVLIIRELTGSRRSISLRGRALPERDGGPKFGGDLRTKRTWYAGNKVATIQVLGPELDDTDFHGYWMDRHLSGDTSQIQATGFGRVTTAVDLVRVFESLYSSGNRIRVQWGPFVRTGVCKSFDPQPERVVDIHWKVRFEWDSRDDMTQPRATTDSPPDAARVRSRQNASDDQLAFTPKVARTDYVALVATGTAGVRSRVGKVFDQIRRVQAFVTVPLGAIQDMVSEVEGMRQVANNLVGVLTETPLAGTTDSQLLTDRLGMDGWRRTQARLAQATLAQSQRDSRELQAQGHPEPVRVIVTNENDTLRNIAAREYGDGDAWQRIAQVNGLVDSLVPPQTVLVIPPLSTQIDTQAC